jgi:hypothetical protein
LYLPIVYFPDGRTNATMRFLLLAAALALLDLSASPRAEATVYRWRDAGGVLHFSNDAQDVPAGQEAVESFTTRVPARRDPVIPDVEGDDAEPPPVSAAGLRHAYERGFDAGLQMASRQLQEAAELARLLVQSEREAPVVIAPPPSRPEVSVSIVRSGDRWGDRDRFYTAGWPVWGPWVYGPGFVGGVVVRPHHHRFGHRSRKSFFAGGRGSVAPVRGRYAGRGDGR